MARMIDADALIEKYIVVIRKDADEKLKTEIAVLLKDIEEQPTIEAEPVRHGKWIETEENHGFDDEVRNKALACSVCKVAFRISDYEQIEDFRFCPNCGARMDEE